jgi:hypothetical protein
MRTVSRARASLPTPLTLALALTAAALSSCVVTPYRGGTIQIDFLADLANSDIVRMPDGSRSHYELWAGFDDDGVLSIATFVVDASRAIYAYPDETRRIGTVQQDLAEGTDTGARFTTEASLESATRLFVTIEADGETDFSPSGVVVMTGDLTFDGEGLMRGRLEGQYTTLLGQTLNPIATAAVVLTEDLE